MKKIFIFFITAGFFLGSLCAKEKMGETLTLSRYIDLALNQSLRSRSAEDNLLSNRYSLTRTQRGLTWPQLGVEASQTRSGSDTDTGIETETDSQTGAVTLTQPFLTDTDFSLSSEWSDSETERDTLGVVTESQSKDKPEISASVSQNLPIFVQNQKWRTRKEALLGWENNQDQYRKERLQIEFDARSIYYNLLLQRESMEVEERKFESAQLVHRITKALVKAGKKPRVELLRADVRAEADRRRIQNAEIALDQAFNQAKDFVLIPTDRKINLGTELSYVPFRHRLDDLINTGLKNNPDILVGRRNIDLQKLGLKRTKEGDRPDFDLTGSYTKTRDRSDAAAPVDPYSWSVRLNMDWPVFDATQTKLSVKRSEIALRNAERNLEAQERNLTVTIKNQFLEVKRTEDQIKSFSKQKETAEKSLKAIRLQYRNGYARLTDVFDAETQLRDLDLEYLGLLVSFNTAKDRLALLIGKNLDGVAEAAE